MLKHFFSSHVSLFFSFLISLSPSLVVCLYVGYRPPSYGVWDRDSDGDDHGEPFVPGERSSAEKVQGPGSGQAVCGGAGDQRTGEDLSELMDQDELDSAELGSE